MIRARTDMLLAIGVNFQHSPTRFAGANEGGGGIRVTLRTWAPALAGPLRNPKIHLPCCAGEQCHFGRNHIHILAYLVMEVKTAGRSTAHG